MHKPLRLLSPVFLTCSALLADISPNPIFQTGAVLQRDMPIPVWGTATREGEPVTVTLGDKSVSTVAKDGKWRVTLPASASGGGALTLTIAGDNTVKLDDILLGEVWICSGQSNMEMKLDEAWPRHIEGWETAITKADHPNLRLFTVARAVADKPLETVAGKWATCTPETAKHFSGVGYFFGSSLQKSLAGVPVGLISTNWGGTPAESWTSRPALDAQPGLKTMLAAHDKSVAAYAVKLAQFEAAKAKADGKPVAKPADPNLDAYSSPAVLRNAMIAPLTPYAIRGVIWYQGESNNGRAAAYGTLFPAMIADWRKDFGRPDLPFLFVQIAPHREMSPEIREAQFLTLGKSAHTAMVVTTDVGDANDIHPTRKQPVGERLARAARALAYGENIEYSGPLFAGAIFADGQATVSFTHTGAGLVAQEGALRGFTLAGADGKFVPAAAHIEADKVIVSAPTVPHPVAVRYGWANVPEVNLANREGLPASPFRSDIR